jgi:hypothetical protein
MRSPADRLRLAAERIVRAAAIILAVLAIVQASASRTPRPVSIRIDQPILAALPELTAARPTTAHVGVRTLPTVVERDWLVALRRAGLDLSWSDEGAARVAISAVAAIDPAGGWTVGVSAPNGMPVEIADAIGMLDSATVAGVGARFMVAGAAGAVIASSGDAVASSTPLPPPARVRPVLVLGSAGWESKFVISALEERGWIVHARLRVSPTSEVTLGPPVTVDTATYGAVILLDSAGAEASRSLIGFVRSGGGLIVAGSAGRSPELATLLPARMGALEPGSLLRATMSSAREGLPMYPLVRLRSDALALDRREGRVVVAARRERAGRVIQVGEIESWRWRMTGGDDAPALHRSWWSRLVGSASYVGAPDPILPATPEAAPYAALVHSLGAPSEVPGLADEDRPADPLPAWIGLAILSLLVAEWASRRLRGAR